VHFDAAAELLGLRQRLDRDLLDGRVAEGHVVTDIEVLLYLGDTDLDVEPVPEAVDPRIEKASADARPGVGAIAWPDRPGIACRDGTDVHRHGMGLWILFPGQHFDG